MAKASLALRKWLNLQESESAGQPRPVRLPAEPFDIALIERLAGVPETSALSELPYEWLFSAAAEPILIVEGVAGNIIEANPAAAALLGTPRPALVGTLLQDAFEASGSRAVQVSLVSAGRAGSAAPIYVRARKGGAKLSASMSLVRVPPHSYFLVHLTAQSQTGSGEQGDMFTSIVLDAIDGASVGFLMTDAELYVEYANRAFVDMVEVASVEDLQGRLLTRWIQFSTRDLAQLRAQMSQRHALTVFRTVLRPKQELMRDVELQAVAVPDERNPCWAFSVCPRTRLN